MLGTVDQKLSDKRTLKNFYPIFERISSLKDQAIPSLNAANNTYKMQK